MSDDVTFEDRNDAAQTVFEASEDVTKDDINDLLDRLRENEDEMPVVGGREPCSEASEGHDWNRVSTGKSKIFTEKLKYYKSVFGWNKLVQPATFHKVKYERWRCPCGQERVNIIKYSGKSTTDSALIVPDEHTERVENDKSLWESFKTSSVKWAEYL